MPAGFSDWKEAREASSKIQDIIEQEEKGTTRIVEQDVWTQHKPKMKNLQSIETQGKRTQAVCSTQSLDYINNALSGNYITVLQPYTVSRSQAIQYIDSDTAIQALIETMEQPPMKYVIADGTLTQFPKTVNLSMSSLNFDSARTGHMKSLLSLLSKTSRLLLAHTDAHLVQNILSDKPVSSYVSSIQNGMQIKEYTSIMTLNHNRLDALLSESFGKKLSTSYWDQLKVAKVLIAGDYQGAVIVLNEGGYMYLDKFAIGKASQGSGIAEVLWAAMVEAFPDLYWRSRVDNPVNKWYFDRSDGHCAVSRWKVFCYGKKSADLISDYVKLANNLSASFE